MSNATSSGVTLNGINLLASEVRAIATAGLPLEPHLRTSVTADARHLIQRTEQVSEQLQQGKSIADIVTEPDSGPDRMLTAALAAGIASGDLAASVELLGETTAELQRLRQQLLQALTYPAMILLLASGLLLFVLRVFLTQVMEILADTDLVIAEAAFDLYELDQKYPAWPWCFPVGLMLLILTGMFRGRGGLVRFDGLARPLLLIPGLARILIDLRFYTLSRMLQLLVGRELPLPESLLLAGACTADPDLQQACHNSVRRLERGDRLLADNSAWQPGRLPPVLSACLDHSSLQETALATGIAGAAQFYHRRLTERMQWMQRVVPGLLLGTVGGGAVLLYGLMLAWPLSELYRILGHFSGM